MGSYLPLITGSGGALVVLVVWVGMLIAGQVHTDGEFRAMEDERNYWRDAYHEATQAMTTERRIATEAAQAGMVTNKLISALTDIAADRSGGKPPRRRRPDLTPEDLGLGGHLCDCPACICVCGLPGPTRRGWPGPGRQPGTRPSSRRCRRRGSSRSGRKSSARCGSRRRTTSSLSGSGGR